MKQIACKPTAEITDADLDGFCFCTDNHHCGGRPCVSCQVIDVRSLPSFDAARWERMEELLRDVSTDMSDAEGDLII